MTIMRTSASVVYRLANPRAYADSLSKATAWGDDEDPNTEAPGGQAIRISQPVCRAHLHAQRPPVLAT
jgi:hypothetical protein